VKLSNFFYIIVLICVILGVQQNSLISRQIYDGLDGAQAHALNTDEDFQEVTRIPIATQGPCHKPCRTIFPFLILLFFMTFIVASTQMPLLMIVLRSVEEEERSFALGMQFVIFRLFGYIPAPILFGNLIDSTCLLWKTTCGEAGGRCLMYDIEKFRYKYIGLCAAIKVLALCIFTVDWLLVKRRKHLEKLQPLNDIGSIISLDKLFEEKDLVQSPQQIISEPIIESGADSNEENKQNLKIILDNPRLPHQRHARSSSYDVKITRSNSSNSDVDRLKKMRMSHTRTNSRDYEIVNNQLNNQQNANIKYIVNHLKKPMGNLNSNFNLNRNFNGRRRHMRNHSYGQEFSFLPNNAIIRLDTDLANKFLLSTSGNNSKHHSRKNSYDKSHSHHHHHHVDLNLLHQKLANQKINDDLLLNEDQEDQEVLTRNPIVTSVIAEEDTILRHRRTNSKDLNSVVVTEECDQVKNENQDEHL
jgi:organic anion transporter 3A